MDWLAVGALLLFILYFSLGSLACVSDDFFYHLSIVDSFRRNFLHPAHESLSFSGAYLDQHTPYHLLVALGSRIMGITAFRTMRIAGMLNLGFFVIAMVIFLRCWTVSLRSALYASLAYFFFSACLRNHSFTWSNDTSVYGLHYILSYPATFSCATSLILLAATFWYWKNPRLWLLAWIPWLAALALLTHLPTGFYALFAAGLLVGTQFLENRKSPTNFRKLAWLLVAAVLGVVLCFLWPYYRISIWFSQVHIPFEGYARIYDHAMAVALPATLCAVPVFFFYAKRKEKIFLLWLAFSSGGIYFLSYCVQMYLFGRYLFFYLSFVAVMLALAARQGWEERKLPKQIKIYFRILPVFPLLACLVLPTQWETLKWSSRVVAKMLRHPTSYDEIILSKMAMLQHYLKPSDIVLINPNNAYTFEANRIAAFTGAKFVYGHRWNIWTHPQRHERARDALAFFQIDSASERQKIIEKYRVSVILLRKDEVSQGRINPALLKQLGKPEDQNDTFFYYRTGS